MDSIDLSSDNPMSVFDMFSEVKVVPLETTPESFITHMSEVLYHQSHYYILDSRSQQIFCFNEQGAFVFKIAAQGKGPGEYNYITDFVIDEKKNQLIVPDPVVQRVHFYDLQGNHLETRRINIPNVLTNVFPLNDSVLLVNSITKDQLVFYNLNQDTAISALFDRNVPSTLEGFSAFRNIYQLNGRTYAMPSLSLDVLDVTDIEPVSHFSWCFGKDNNSPQQIENLLQEFRNRQRGDARYIVALQGVGKGKVLTQHIMMVFESSRFRIAFVEFDGNMKHVVLDKKTNESYVFNAFKEEVGLPAGGFQASRVITNSIPMYSEDFMKRRKEVEPEFPMEFFIRIPEGYTREILNRESRIVVENHDPMRDNPFLVVYIFRE